MVSLDELEIHDVLSLHWKRIPHGRILDIGCDKGDTALFLAQQGRGNFTVEAIDVKESNVDEVSRKAAANKLPIETGLADVRTIPLVPQKYQAICAFLVLHFVDTTAKPLLSGRRPTLFETQHKRIVDAIAPGGLFFCKLLLRTQYEEGYSFDPHHEFPMSADRIVHELSPLHKIHTSEYWGRNGWHTDQGIQLSHRHYFLDYVGIKS